MEYIIKTNTKKIKKIGLALGGGGARGFSFLGVLKAFEEHDIVFDFVAGTSVGALFGAFYCAGKSYDEILEIARSIDKKDIKKGIIPFLPTSTDGIADIVRNNLGDINIEDLKIPFCAVAVDIKTGDEVHLYKGNLAKAVAASCAVPGLFSAVRMDDYLLFDGGLQNTIPTNVPKINNCQVTVGVDINSTRGSGTNSSKYIDQMFAAFSIMMKGNTIKGYINGDVMIKPNLKRFKSTSLVGSEDMLNEGYIACVDKIPQIKMLLKRKNKKGFFSKIFFLKKKK